MVEFTKKDGQRVAYDAQTDTCYPVSALAVKIAKTGILTAPMTEELSSSLRYAFAKYDSQDLADAYAELYALYLKGILF